MLITAFAFGVYLLNIIEKLLYFLTCVMMVTSARHCLFSPLYLDFVVLLLC